MPLALQAKVLSTVKREGVSTSCVCPFGSENFSRNRQEARTGIEERVFQISTYTCALVFMCEWEGLAAAKWQQDNIAERNSI
jgi:hypothetical protein